MLIAKPDCVIHRSLVLHRKYGTVTCRANWSVLRLKGKLIFKSLHNALTHELLFDIRTHVQQEILEQRISMVRTGTTQDPIVLVVDFHHAR